MRVLVALALIGIWGFAEGLVGSSYPFLALLVSFVFGIRHFQRLSLAYAIVRLISEVLVVWSIVVAMWIAFLLYLVLFVPHAFSH